MGRFTAVKMGGNLSYPLALAFVLGAFAPASASAVVLERSSFRLPMDAEPNNSRHIGPFCCTGRTAVVRAVEGHPVAYIYYHAFPGGVIRSGEATFGSQLSIPVSAAIDPANPASPHARGRISFRAGEMVSGFSRSVRLGGLYFRATIGNARRARIHGRVLYELGLVGIRVDVSTRPPGTERRRSPHDTGTRGAVRVHQSSPACSLRPASGPCKASMDRYYYDRVARRCRSFTWGGCAGVVPFESLQQCMASCE